MSDNTQELCMMITMVNALKGMSDNINSTSKSLEQLRKRNDTLLNIVKLQQQTIEDLEDRIKKLEYNKK